jgi:hypothetical protein
MHFRPYRRSPSSPGFTVPVALAVAVVAWLFGLRLAAVVVAGLTVALYLRERRRPKK